MIALLQTNGVDIASLWQNFPQVFRRGRLRLPAALGFWLLLDVLPEGRALAHEADVLGAQSVF